MAIKFTGPRFTWRMVIFVMLWRWFTGNTLDGDPRTDAGWFRQGRKSVTPQYPHPTRWQLWPRWKRMGVRLLTGVLPAVALTAWLLWPEWTYRAGMGICAVLVGVTARIAYKAWGVYDMKHNVLQPYTLALAPMISSAPAALMRDMKVVMEHRPDDGKVPVLIAFPIPAEYTPATNGTAEIARLTGQRLGGEWNTGLNMRRWPFSMKLTRKPDPRGSFTYNDLLSVIEESGGPGKLILGGGTGDSVVVADVINKYPHVALSIGTGGGKSWFLSNVIAQLSYWGEDDFDICDPKWVSLMGLENVPGLRYHRDVEIIWKVVHEFREEMHRRYDEMLAGRKTFPGKYLILEEMNAFAMLSSIRWEEVKVSGDKKKEPVWADIKIIAVMARQVNMHLIGAWQLLLAIASGGDTQLRDQFGLKILSRFSPQAWNLLVGTSPRETSSSIPGRAVAVMEGERVRFQMPSLSPEDSMDLVMRGRAWQKHNGGVLLTPTPINSTRRRPRPRKAS
jgi:hypothetical protein